MVGAVHRNLHQFLETKGVFILIAILEHSEYRDSLRGSLQRQRGSFQNISFNPGVAVLLKLMDSKIE